MQPIYAIRSLFIVAMFALLSACATMPDLQTYEERLAAIEIGYQEALTTATRWRTEGRLSDDAIAKFDAAFDEYESYRDLALVVIRVGDAARSDIAVGNVSKALTALRTILAENAP